VGGSAQFANALQSFPAAQQAFDVCRENRLPALADLREESAFRAACQRLLQPWPQVKGSDHEESAEE
jgi:hypothetical protein